MKPYYADDFATLYHGNCLDVLPHLEPAALILTDPPYGIGQDKGVGGGGGGIIPRKASVRSYAASRGYVAGWDKDRPSAAVFQAMLGRGEAAIIWGGNYFADMLPRAGRWLVWDKEQAMPSYSDAELAWTTLRGVATYMFRYAGNGLFAKERTRYHPTQKPVALMTWCMAQADRSARAEVGTVLDPFAGSGTTLVAAKQLGRRSVGIELDERYCEIAARRLAQEYLPLGV